MSQVYALPALQRLGWDRRAGAPVSPENLRRQLGVTDKHSRFFGRLLGLLARPGILTAADEGCLIEEVGALDPLPYQFLRDPDSLAEQLLNEYPHGTNELGLLRRCASQPCQTFSRVESIPSCCFSGMKDRAPQRCTSRHRLQLRRMGCLENRLRLRRPLHPKIGS